MGIFNNIQKAKIKRLEVKIEELLIYQGLREKPYDTWVKNIINAYTPEELIKYLRLRAELNIRMAEQIGYVYEDTTPKILDSELVNIMDKVSQLKRDYEAQLESAYLFLKVFK
jgi:translation initiation factor RLI1